MVSEADEIEDRSAAVGGDANCFPTSLVDLVHDVNVTD
jgi:hypothetical protein